MSKTQKYKNFKPQWEQVPPAKNSYRALFKWGDPFSFKEPKESLYKLMKQHFELTDADFQEKKDTGNEEISQAILEKFASPLYSLEHRHVDFFISVCGKENVCQDVYNRIRVAYGKTMHDLYRLREQTIEHIPLAVVSPNSEEEIEKIVHYCSQENIPIYVYGGGSSVTRGLEAVKGGVTLDLGKNFNKVISFNETNQTITVEAGMSGPKLENILNNAVDEWKAKRAYTCGHFPQSFEFSTVGGWVVTRGSGQNSTYYGNIRDIVMGQTYITPTAKIKSYGLPAHAVGPEIDEIMMGSEGSFGVLTHVTLKVFRHLPQNRKRFSFVFKNWQDAQNAAREIMQAQAGFPSVFRLSDAEETDIMLRLYSVEGTPLESLMNLMGYKPMHRCLFLGYTEGEKKFSKNLWQTVKRVCKKHGALYLTGYPVKKWEEGRFSDPYLRESLQDYGIVIDTMECAATWDNLSNVHSEVRKFAKSRPQTFCMTHISHAYPQGANLYFIFIGKFSHYQEYQEYQFGIFDNIMRAGASLSHHHGVGKMTAAWVEQAIGTENLDIFRALKKHFDPNNVMNAGGTLGLDLTEEQKRKPRFFNSTWDKPLY